MKRASRHLVPCLGIGLRANIHAGFGASAPRASMRLRSHGFTLVELLIAIALFALISTLAYSSLDSILQTRRSLDSDLQRWQTITGTLARIEHDLGSMYPRVATGEDGRVLPPLTLDTRGELSVSRFGFGALEGADRAPQRLTYSLRDATLRVTRAPALDAAAGARAESIELLDRIASFEVRCLDRYGNRYGAWPRGGDAAELPAAIELTLTPANGGAITRVFALRS